MSTSPTSGGAKVLVIGLDGASPELMGRWVAEGRLPHIASVAERGHLTTLESTPNYLSPSAWSSFVTGLGPGNHGVFFFRDRVPGTYRTFYGNASTRDGVPMWTALSEAGKKVASLFVPMTWPAVPVNGVLAADWMAPSLHDPAYAYPREYVARILQVDPDFRLHTGMNQYTCRGNYVEPLAQKKQLLRSKTAVALDLLTSDAWDLFTVVMHETDPIQHFYWHFLDPHHPDHNMPGADAYRSAILEIYQAADEAVGRLLDAVGEDTFVFIMSDHGAGLNDGGCMYLKDLLRAVGLEAPRRAGLGQSLARGLRRFAHRVLPEQVRYKAMASVPGLHGKLARAAFESDVDWQRTQAYTFFCGSVSEPWLNVRGREPQGQVEPGDAYERVLERVMETVLEARDLRTGEPVAERLSRKTELYAGPYIDRAPDLMVHWREDLVIRGLRVGGNGTVLDKPISEHTTSGSHRLHGVLVAAGPRNEAAECPANAQIIDLAPTIYGLLDMAPPHPLDGRPWTELFPNAIRVHPPVRDRVTSVSDGAQSQDDDVVQQRLEDLGYI